MPRTSGLVAGREEWRGAGASLGKVALPIKHNDSTWQIGSDVPERRAWLEGGLDGVRLPARIKTPARRVLSCRIQRGRLGQRGRDVLEITTEELINKSSCMFGEAKRSEILKTGHQIAQER